MPIDVTIQFNGHNSYRVTETVYCDPFGVEGMAYVTHSFHAYAASALGAATRARTRFFAADGSIVGTIPMTNLLTNGSFENDSNSDGLADGLVIASSAGATSSLDASVFLAGVKSQKIITVGGYANMAYPFASVIGHIYYSIQHIKTDTSYIQYGLVTASDADAQGYVIGDNTWRRYTSTLAAIGTTTHLPIKYQNYTSATTYIDCWSVVDLTAAFGAGNEPTAAQMDAWLLAYDPTNSWFDGTANVATSAVGTIDHSFAVAAVFTEVDITVAVPGTAVLCQVSFLTSGTWWVVEPKSEEGQTATPYNTNYQGQLSMITPDGAYLGFLHSTQIVVVGTLANPTESLETRLVTINNNAITLSATSAAHGTRLTSIEAGYVVISGSGNYASGYDPTTKETPAGAQTKVNALGATLGNLAYENLVEVAKLGTTIISGGYIKGELLDVDNLIAHRLSNLDDLTSYAEMGVVPGGGHGLSLWRDAVNFIRVVGTVGTGFTFLDVNDHGRFYADAGQTLLDDGASYSRLVLSGTYNYSTLRAFNGESYNEIGVDGTGAYIVIAGVKTYITTGGSGGDPSGWDKTVLTLNHPAYKATVHISTYPDSTVVLEPYVDYWTSPYIDGYAAPYARHMGWDCYSVTSHAPIYAVADGYVYEAHDFVAGMYGAATSGIYVAIRTAGCIGCHSTTAYKHLNSRVVNTNDSITAGQLIGYQGKTGDSTGEHLHFDLFINYDSYDPIEYLLGIKPWQIGT